MMQKRLSKKANKIALLCGRLLLLNHQRLHREIRNVWLGSKQIALYRWLSFVLNYLKPSKLKIGYVMIAINGVKPQSTSKRTVNRVQRMKSKKTAKKRKIKCLPLNHLRTSDLLAVVEEAMMMMTLRLEVVGIAVVIPSGPPPGDPDNDGEPEVTEVKIPRREADKVVVPHLDSWMSGCIANVLSACADANYEDWIGWLQPAFCPGPDIEGMNESGHIRFKSIDVKLGVAMTAMLKSAGDNAADLYLDANRKANHYVRTIKRRQIIAMMYESFRSLGHDRHAGLPYQASRSR